MKKPRAAILLAHGNLKRKEVNTMTRTLVTLRHSLEQSCLTSLWREASFSVREQHEHGVIKE